MIETLREQVELTAVIGELVCPDCGEKTLSMTEFEEGWTFTIDCYKCNYTTGRCSSRATAFAKADRDLLDKSKESPSVEEVEEVEEDRKAVWNLGEEWPRDKAEVQYSKVDLKEWPHGVGGEKILDELEDKLAAANRKIELLLEYISIK